MRFTIVTRSLLTVLFFSHLTRNSEVLSVLSPVSEYRPMSLDALQKLFYFQPKKQFSESEEKRGEQLNRKGKSTKLKNKKALANEEDSLPVASQVDYKESYYIPFDTYSEKGVVYPHPPVVQTDEHKKSHQTHRIYEHIIVPHPSPPPSDHHYHHHRDDSGWGWSKGWKSEVHKPEKDDLSLKELLELLLAGLALLAMGFFLAYFFFNYFSSGSSNIITLPTTTGGITMVTNFPRPTHSPTPSPTPAPTPAPTMTMTGTATGTGPTEPERHIIMPQDLTFVSGTGVHSYAVGRIGEVDIDHDEIEDEERKMKPGSKRSKRSTRTGFELFIDPWSAMDTMSRQILNSLNALNSTAESKCANRILCDSNHQSRVIGHGFQIAMPSFSAWASYWSMETDNGTSQTWMTWGRHLRAILLGLSEHNCQVLFPCDL